MKSAPTSASRAAIDIAGLFAEPLRDLGEDDASLAGILAPASADRFSVRGVTAQFLENAGEYHRRYENVGHFRVLIDDALATLDPPIEPQVILDLGSGSGNSVIPLLDRFPKAFVVATDISPQLLSILREHLAGRPQHRDRCALVCMDACDDPYRDGMFDLAFGAAILHHVLEPQSVIRACEHALKPGGAAIFFEPFESGHAVLHLAYRQIVREAQYRGDASEGFAVLRRLLGDYEARRRDSRDAVFLDLDDKWMFDRAYFEAIAARGRWGGCRIYPIHEATTPLAVQARNHLELVTDGAAPDLPEWAWATLSDYERAFSPHARRELIFEAAVVLRLADARVDPGSGWWWNPREPGRGFFVELARDAARVTCCAYDDAGNPAWQVAGPRRLLPNGEIALEWRRPTAPNIENEAARERIEDAGSAVLRFDAPRAAQLDFGNTSTALEPQRPENPGRVGWASQALTGQWIEDSEAPRWRLLVEALGDRIVVALLSHAADWCIAEGSQVGARSYAGQWRRFSGGQTLSGPYRVPAQPEEIGEARFLWTDVTSVLVTLPGRHRVAMRRLELAP